MGKKRIEQLLEQLKANQQEELQNAAAIFTVAQVAVNTLEAQQEGTNPSALTGSNPIAALPPVPLTKADLQQRYGDYKACRKAAKTRGIKFKQTPSWPQLVAAFSYAEALEQMVRSYLESNPQPALKGVTIQLSLSAD